MKRGLGNGYSIPILCMCGELQWPHKPSLFVIHRIPEAPAESLFGEEALPSRFSYMQIREAQALIVSFNLQPPVRSHNYAL